MVDHHDVQAPPLKIYAPSPLEAGPSPAHLEQIAVAKKLGKPMRRAATVATIGGWTTGVFGVLTLAFGLFTPTGLLLGLAMGVVSYFEFQGATGLRRLDANALKRLALNQLFFGIALFSYAAWSMYTSITQPGELAQISQTEPALRDMLGPMEDIGRMIALTVYGTLMIVAVVAPGLTGLYYRSRKPHLDRYVSEVARWITDLQRAGMSVY